MIEPRLRDYLGHVLEAIDRINRYIASQDFQAFVLDTLVQDAVIRNFENIGEASRNIRLRYPDFANAHPELPLNFAYEMRNRLSHGYFSINLETVWKTNRDDLPDMRAKVVTALQSMAQEEL